MYVITKILIISQISNFNSLFPQSVCVVPVDILLYLRLGRYVPISVDIIDPIATNIGHSKFIRRSVTDIARHVYHNNIRSAEIVPFKEKALFLRSLCKNCFLYICSKLSTFPVK